MTHPVIDALARRPHAARIALVVEGGGMRGAVSGGMVLALDELGLTRAFHAAYGASAGALNAMWLISGRVRDGIPTWVDPRLVHALIDRRRALRGGPVVDVRTLVETRYEQLSPGLFDAVLAARPSCTRSPPRSPPARRWTSRRPIVDPPSLRRALRASAGLPLLAGPPVDGRRTAVRRRRPGRGDPGPRRGQAGRDARARAALAARRRGRDRARAGQRSARGGVAAPDRPRPGARVPGPRPREAADEALLARHDADPDLRPHILSVRPAPDSPVPSRLDKDVAVVAAGLEAGRVALHAAFDAWA